MTNDRLNVKFDYPEILNYALVQSQKTEPASLDISSSEELRDVVFTVSGEGITEVRTPVSMIPAGNTVTFRDIRITPDADRLRKASESASGMISLTIVQHAGSEKPETVFREDYPVRILAFNEWPGCHVHPELIASFVTPNAPELSAIQARAGAILKKLTGDSALDGYQTRDANRVRAQAAAVFDALREQGILYSVPPASFERTGQRIRLAPDVLKEKVGTCADASILMASVLESVGLHPLIITVPGHMFIGCWLVDKYSAQPVTDDASFLRSRSGDGVNELVLVNAVCICSDSDYSFEDAVAGTKKYLSDDAGETVIVDVKRCRLERVLPLPLEGEAQENEGVRHEAVTDGVESHYSIDEDDLSDEKGSDYRRRIWERKLLDLTLRNNLLNMRTGRKVMAFMPGNAGRVEDILQAGRDLSIQPNPESGSDELISEGLKRGSVYSELKAEDLQPELTHLYRESRNSLDENGANTLFIVFGTLRWFETEKSVVAREAPLLLFPVQLIRKSAGTFVLRGRDEDMNVNTTLLEYLRTQFGVTVKGLGALPADESGYDIDRILATIRAQIAGRPRWEVRDRCLLGLFSFSKFVMWNDIHENFSLIAKNPIIDALVARRTLGDGGKEVDIRSIDEHEEPGELCVPIEADSSQLSAVAMADGGRSFIMYGPPGTGKSQTITNIIANALCHDKRVLFVAEKAAALEVVQKRLERIGIGAFCLELHSNKATRSHMLGQLQEALDAGHPAEPAEFEEKSRELFEERQHLQKYIDALHASGSRGLSVHDCIEGYELRAGSPLGIDRACITDSMTKDDITALAGKVSGLESVFSVSGNPADHPLSGLIVKEESLSASQKLSEGLSRISGPLPGAVNALVRYEELLHREGRAAFSDLEEACVSIGTWESAEDEKRKLLATWAPEALDLQPLALKQEWEGAKDSFILFRYFKKKSFIKKTRIYNMSLTAENADGEIDALLSYSRMRRDMPEGAVRAGELSADDRNTLKSLQEALHSMSGVAEIELPSLKDAEARMQSWLGSTGKARDWAYWCRARKELMDLHMEPVLNAVIADGVPPREAAERFLRAVYRNLASGMIDAAPELREFRGPVFEESIRKYRSLAEEFRLLSQKELFCRLAARIPQRLSEPSAQSEMGKLRRYIASKGRGMTIRRIFDEVPNLISRLCPCMLMSPISVAQFLSLEREPFDLVIFDEASQMPTSEAVGTIARGRALVVAGDPKQMPPTSFFSSDTTDESESDYDDMESILDDCRTLSMDAAPLQWHYRSRSESLIAFSNLEYYGGSLYTFPSVRDRVSMVRYVPVEGTYDFGRTRSNRAEADAIADEVIRRWRDPVLRKDSIGIIAFSKAQQNLIDDVLTERIAGDPELEAMASQENEGLFVKNLENVQGDERDVILFSVGYGPDSRGRVSMNFGPLNGKGGERRLNVAVSRARKEMVVFAILRPEQIDLTRSSSRGVEGLRRFLEFARSGQIALSGSQLGIHADNGIAAAVADEIRRMGYAVDTSVGRSNFRVDIAVSDPKDRDRYILGILCDGEGYYRTKTERDREIVQPSVLRGLGWRLIRVWSVDWFVNREKELSRIREALREAERAGGMPEEPAGKTEPLPASQETDPSQEAPAAALHEGSGDTGSAPAAPDFRRAPGQGIDDIPSGQIDDAILFVVSQSVSLPEQDLRKSAAKALGFARTGAHIDQVLSAHIGGLVCGGRLRRQDESITMP